MSHRADALRAVLSTIMHDLEKQRNAVLFVGQSLDSTVGQLKALGDWDDGISNGSIVLDKALPNDLRAAAEKYERAINFLRVVYDRL